MPLKIVKTLSEISPFLNRPYNQPEFSENFRAEDFEKEYNSVYERVKRQLEIFGEVSNFGKSGISLGPPAKSRKIGIVIDSEECFRSELIVALKDVLDNTQVDYLVYIDGEDEAENSFYICLTKGREALAYAENAESLQPFLE